MEYIKHTLDPIYDINSKILILGTIPSPKSREFEFYYSHPQNRFWKVISHVLNNMEPKTNIEKESFLIKNNIALWDVLKSCNITGADDSSIKNPVVNDICSILKKTRINKIFTTGSKSTFLYKKYCLGDTLMESLYLPSTSAANCRNYNYDKLVQEYMIILKYLG